MSLTPESCSAEFIIQLESVKVMSCYGTHASITVSRQKLIYCCQSDRGGSIWLKLTGFAAFQQAAKAGVSTTNV